MNIIDIVLSILFLLGFVRGFFKGFLVELAGLIALILGIYGAIHFSGNMLEFLQGFISWEEKYLSLVAFALTFILIVVLISLLGKLLTKMVNILALGIVNRILGAVFGFLKIAFLASLFFMFFNQFNGTWPEKETKSTSVLYPPVERFAPLILPTIIQELQEKEFLEAPSEKNN